VINLGDTIRVEDIRRINKERIKAYRPKERRNKGRGESKKLTRERDS